MLREYFAVAFGWRLHCRLIVCFLEIEIVTEVPATRLSSFT